MTVPEGTLLPVPVAVAVQLEGLPTPTGPEQDTVKELRLPLLASVNVVCA